MDASERAPTPHGVSVCFSVFAAREPSALARANPGAAASEEKGAGSSDPLNAPRLAAGLTPFSFKYFSRFSFEVLPTMRVRDGTTVSASPKFANRTGSALSKRRHVSARAPSAARSNASKSSSVHAGNLRSASISRATPTASAASDVSSETSSAAKSSTKLAVSSSTPPATRPSAIERAAVASPRAFASVAVATAAADARSRANVASGITRAASMSSASRSCCASGSASPNWRNRPAASARPSAADGEAEAGASSTNPSEYARATPARVPAAREPAPSRSARAMPYAGEVTSASAAKPAHANASATPSAVRRVVRCCAFHPPATPRDASRPSAAGASGGRGAPPYRVVVAMTIGRLGRPRESLRVTARPVAARGCDHPGGWIRGFLSFFRLV